MPLPRPQRRGLLGALLLQALFAAPGADADAEDEGIACGTLVEASSLTELRDYLATGPKHIFMDLDEVVIMPDFPFVGGLPYTESFLNTVKSSGHSCKLTQVHWPKIFGFLDRGRIAAPFKLVDDGFPTVIRDLRLSDKSVLALTTRDKTWGHSYSFSADRFMSSHTLVEFLANSTVKFDPLPRKAKKVGNATKAGAILFGGMTAMGRHLTEIMTDVIPKGEKAVFVHANSRTLRGALEARGDTCLVGVHFKGAGDGELDDAARVRWLCDVIKDLANPPKDCELCPELHKADGAEL